MNPETLPLWLALFTQIGLGFAVFRANPQNYANQAFLLVSLTISFWLLSLHFAYNAVDAAAAALWIRNSSASGIAIVVGFNLLRLAIVCRALGWREIVRRSALLLIGGAGIACLCYTDWFLHGALLRPGQAPDPEYGPLSSVFAAFVAGAVAAVVALYLRDLRRVGGMQKVELQFVIAGSATMFVLVVLGIILQPLLPREVLVLFAPFRVVIFSLIIAYGIATRKIMEVGFFFRRITAYAVLTAYLLAFYASVWWLVFLVCKPGLGESARLGAHLLAALGVAFAMAPARGVSQTLANRLFVGNRGLDFRSTMNEAAEILRSVTTLRELLKRFAKTIGGAVATDRTLILLPDRGVFREQYPGRPGPGSMTTVDLPADDPIIRYLENRPEPLVLDALHRLRSTPELDRVMERMHQLQLAVAMPHFFARPSRRSDAPWPPAFRPDLRQ